MNDDERELRKALDARSATPSPQFRARLSETLKGGPPRDSVTPAIAGFVAVALVVATVGLFTYVRLHRAPPSGVASGARVTSPSPSPLYGPTTVELSAPSRDVVWALVADQALFLSTDHGTTWQKRSLPAQVGLPPSISFVNDREGWLLSASSPETQCEAQLAELWHTTDGAQTWKDLGERIDKTQCKDGIWFLDSRHGFVTASDTNQRPTVYRTEDGGETWAFSTVPDNPLFTTASGGFTLHVNWIKSFGQTIYLEASGSQDDASWHDRDFIYTSSDGGATWQWKQKLASRDTVMVTESRWLQFTPDIMESVNGGQAFGLYQTDFTPLSPVLGGTRVTFADATVGYATGRGSMERTVDGGAHWKIVPTPGMYTPSPAPSPVATPVDVQLSAPSSTVVWALIGYASLLRSTDQGTTWAARPLPTSGPVTSISFTSANEGWVMRGGPGATQCTFGGITIWHTADAGATWTTLLYVSNETPTSPTDIGFQQCKEYVTFIDAKHGYVTAWDDNGPPTIYRTSDGGVTWSASRLADPAGFRTIGAGDALRAEPVRRVGSELLVAASGMQPDGLHSYVFRSLDLGASWAPLVEVPAATVAFLTELHWLLLTTYPGKSEETTTAGQQWQLFASDYRMLDSARGSAMVFATSTIGYAEGAIDTAGNAALLRTTDGGAHWSAIKPLAPAQS